MVCEEDHTCISLREADDDKGSFDAFIPLHPRQPHGQDNCFLSPREGTSLDVARDRMWLLRSVFSFTFCATHLTVWVTTSSWTSGPRLWKNCYPQPCMQSTCMSGAVDCMPLQSWRFLCVPYLVGCWLSLVYRQLRAREVFCKQCSAFL